MDKLMEVNPAATELTIVELEQATREIMRYLREFPEQRVFSREEIVNWFTEVVLVIGSEDLAEEYCRVCKGEWRVAG